MRIWNFTYAVIFIKDQRDYQWTGGYCDEEPPDPIPNSDVKLVHANGTSA